MDKTILFTGGGTAGHVFPALAVAAELRKHFSGTIVWVGSRKGMEKKFVQEAGIPFIRIPTGKVRRYFSLRNITDLFSIFFGVLKSLRICTKYKPSLVFSKGGYVSVPVVFAAGRKKIPVITHESDVDPGLATRFNARYALKVCIAFRETEDSFSAIWEAKGWRSNADIPFDEKFSRGRKTAGEIFYKRKKGGRLSSLSGEAKGRGRLMI